VFIPVPSKRYLCAWHLANGEVVKLILGRSWKWSTAHLCEVTPVTRPVRGTVSFGTAVALAYPLVSAIVRRTWQVSPSPPVRPSRVVRDRAECGVLLTGRGLFPCAFRGISARDGVSGQRAARTFASTTSGLIENASDVSAETVKKNMAIAPCGCSWDFRLRRSVHATTGPTSYPSGCIGSRSVAPGAPWLRGRTGAGRVGEPGRGRVSSPTRPTPQRATSCGRAWNRRSSPRRSGRC